MPSTSLFDASPAQASDALSNEGNKQESRPENRNGDQRLPGLQLSVEFIFLRLVVAGGRRWRCRPARRRWRSRLRRPRWRHRAWPRCPARGRWRSRPRHPRWCHRAGPSWRRHDRGRRGCHARQTWRCSSALRAQWCGQRQQHRERKQSQPKLSFPTFLAVNVHCYGSSCTSEMCQDERSNRAAKPRPRRRISPRVNSLPPRNRLGEFAAQRKFDMQRSNFAIQA